MFKESEFLILFLALLLILLNQISCFKAGYSYFYTYETNTQVFIYKNQQKSNDLKSSDDLHLIRARFSLNAFVNEPLNVLLVELRIEDLNCDQVHFSDETRKAILNEKAAFEYDNVEKRVLHILFGSKETDGSILFKKSLIDLFNLNKLAKIEKSFIGNCQIDQVNTHQNDTQLVIRKLKYNCVRSSPMEYEFKRNEEILNLMQHRQSILDYNLSARSEQLIESISASDIIKIYMEFNTKTYQDVVTRQEIRLIDQQLNENAKINNLSIKDLLVVENEIKMLDSKINELNLDTNLNNKFEKIVLKKLKAITTKKETKVGTRFGCKSFLDLVKMLRYYLTSNEKSLEKMLTNNAANSKIFKLATEIVVASQNQRSFEILTKSIGIHGLNSNSKIFDIKKIKWLEDLLMSLSLSSQSSTTSIDQVKNLIENNDKIPDLTLNEKSLLTLGSLVYFYQEGNKNNLTTYYLNLIRSFLSKTKNKDLQLAYLESLKNSRIEESFEVIQNEFNNDVPSFQTIKQLNNFYDSNLFTKSMLNKLIMIFGRDEKYQNATDEQRIEALNVILEKYTTSLLSEDDSSLLLNILYQLQDESFKKKSNDEFLFFCQRLLLQKMNSNELFKNKVQNLFKNSKLSFINFYTQIGSSNYLSDVLKKYQTGSLAYSLKQLMTNDGYMQLIDFAVSFTNWQNKPLIDFLRFEVYTSNLNSLSASLDKSQRSKEENSDPAASIHLSVMGQKILINQLFRGYSDMINLFWKLPTKKTSLVNFNFLINDQNQYVLLPNGMKLRMELLGATSLDISGMSDVSLWNMYANINMELNAAVWIEQKLTLISDFNLVEKLEFDFDTHFSANFNLNSEFQTTPAKVCSKMSHRKFFLNEGIRLFKTSSDNKLVLLKDAYKRSPIQGSTFMFSRKAVASC